MEHSSKFVNFQQAEEVEIEEDDLNMSMDQYHQTRSPVLITQSAISAPSPSWGGAAPPLQAPSSLTGRLGSVMSGMFSRGSSAVPSQQAQGPSVQQAQGPQSLFEQSAVGPSPAFGRQVREELAKGAARPCAKRKVFRARVNTNIVVYFLFFLII